jgi:hypothetical protein
MKTLVIILGETRAHELTFNNFKENLIDVLNADLCLCIGAKPDYDYENPFYKLAKYKFLYNEPDDYSDAFDYAYNIIEKNKYEILYNINTLYGKISYPNKSTDNITYYGLIDDNHDNLLNSNFNDDDQIVIHTNDFYINDLKRQIYGIKKSDNNYIIEDNVITLKKGLYWREFLKIKDQFMGGIKDKDNQHIGSGAIQIFYRWFLLKNLIDYNLIDKYDRFVITRSDYIYQLPFPNVEKMNINNIWIPDSEHCNGYTDRNVILSKTNIEPYLNILNNMVSRSNEYFYKMRYISYWNIELLIKFNLDQNNVLHLVKEFPYIMYTCRTNNISTRWAEGVYVEKLGYFVKYLTEYNKSSDYLIKFNNSGLTIDEFYKDLYQ